MMWSFSLSLSLINLIFDIAEKRRSTHTHIHCMRLPATTFNQHVCVCVNTTHQIVTKLKIVNEWN